MANQTIHQGHRARLRERFMRTGPAGFADHELLELFLSYAIPRKDVNPIAHALLDRFGGLREVMEANWRDLLAVEGIGSASALLLSVATALVRRSEAQAKALMTLSSREDVITLGRELVAAEQDEVFYALLLDKGFRLLEARLLTRGVPDQVVVYPRSVVQAALQFGATRVILLHNHPGGNAAPSTDDVVLTQKIEGVLGAIGIELIDHYIICGMEGYSILHRAVFAAPARAGASRAAQSNQLLDPYRIAELIHQLDDEQLSILIDQIGDGEEP